MEDDAKVRFSFELPFWFSLKENNLHGKDLNLPTSPFT